MPLFSENRKSSTTLKSEQAYLTTILSFLNRVSKIPDDYTDFQTGTERIFEEVGNYTKWPIGHLYMITPESDGKYISNKTWYLDDQLDASAIALFKKMSEETVFEKGKGLIGLIAENQESKSLEDVTVMEKFLRADAAKQSGVRRFFGFPIIVNHNCVGVAEFFGREPGLINATSLEIMQYVSSQLARLYERDTARREKAQLIEQYKEEVQGSISELQSNTKTLGEVSENIQQQVSQNTVKCNQVYESKTSIAQNMEVLSSAMTILHDVEQKTSESNNEVNITIDQLSTQVAETMNGFEEMNAVTLDIEKISREVATVSGQVRMLGLNAAIEAERAGEHGKGFAIVANEIKALANISDESAQKISAQLVEIQKISGKSITFINHVTQSMDRLKSKTDELSSVIVDHKSATDEISQNLVNAQDTFYSMERDIEGLSNFSQTLTDVSNLVFEQTTSVKSLCENITVASDHFIVSIEKS